MISSVFKEISKRKEVKQLFKGVDRFTFFFFGLKENVLRKVFSLLE